MDDEKDNVAWGIIQPLLLDKAYSFKRIAEEMGVSEEYVKELAEEKWTQFTILDNGPAIFKALVRTWERYIEFGNPWHPRLLSLFVLQSYFYRSLPAVFYVGLTGPKASAKTMVLEILRDLCADAVMTGDCSPAAMARRLDKGCTLLIDEVDEMKDEMRDLPQGAARRGYRPGNVYLRWDPKAKKEEEISIYGPKAFSFIQGIEDALKSRTVEIETVRVKDDPFGKVLDNLARGIRRLEDLKKAVGDYCKEKASAWAPQAILGLLESPEFRSDVEDAVGNAAFPRDIELAAVCLVTAKMADVEIAEDTRTALEAQAVFEDEAISDFVKHVKENVGGLDVGAYVLLKELRDALNRSRKDTGERPVHHKKFRALLREIGLREGQDLKRLAGEGNHILVITEHTKQVLGLTQTDGSRIPSQTGLGWFTVATDDSRNREGTSYSVKDQRERVKKLREVSKALSEGVERCFTFDGLVAKSEPFGITKEQVKRWIEEAVKTGELYNPSGGGYRFV